MKALSNYSSKKNGSDAYVNFPHEQEKLKKLLIVFTTIIIWGVGCVPQEQPFSTPQPPTPQFVQEAATQIPRPTPPRIPPDTPEPEPTETPAQPTIEPTETPFYSPTPTTLPCLLQAGTITQHRLSSPLSVYPWEYRVYTPPCYDEFPDRRYPLLILIHGSTYTDAQWDDLGADEMVARLYQEGEIAPFIILMPRDRVWTEPDEDPFGQAVMDYILPWVEQNYRTIDHRDYRAVGGLSRGGAWAIHLGLQHWEIFSAIGGHSAPVFWSDSVFIRRWLDAIPLDQVPRISLDIGEKDYLMDSAVWFEKLLTEKKIPHEWYLLAGRHDEAYWRNNMEKYIRWYAEPWQILE